MFDAMKANPDVIEFVKLTLARSFLRKYEKYLRCKPPKSDILWIGDNRRILGIGIVIKPDRWRDIIFTHFKHPAILLMILSHFGCLLSALL